MRQSDRPLPMPHGFCLPCSPCRWPGAANTRIADSSNGGFIEAPEHNPHSMADISSYAVLAWRTVPALGEHTRRSGRDAPGLKNNSGLPQGLLVAIQAG